MSSRPHTIGPAPNYPHTHTIILLHGRDSVAPEFAAELFESEASVPANRPRTLLDLLPTVRWVFPAAPLLPSARFGVPLSQWFDIWSVEEPNEQVELQKSGLRSSVEAILQTVVEEETIMGRDSIFLGGISQGFATVVAAFFAGGKGLAGLVGMSSWMPAALDLPVDNLSLEQRLKLLRAEFSGQGGEAGVVVESMVQTPVFLTHSTDDEVVPPCNGRALRDGLRAQAGLNVEWHEYMDGGHWINEPQGVDDLVAFLKEAGVPYHGL
ncbi:hypothetical protein ACHAQA_004821 [Verticillium albo-atrum]